MRRGKVVLAAGECWQILRYDLFCPGEAYGSEGRDMQMKGEVDYEYGPNGIPYVSRIHQVYGVIGGVGDTSQESLFEIQEISFDVPEESIFTLAGYGFPEPELVATRGGVRGWAIWITGVIVALLGIAVLLKRSLKRVAGEA